MIADAGLSLPADRRVERGDVVDEEPEYGVEDLGHPVFRSERHLAHVATGEHRAVGCEAIRAISAPELLAPTTSTGPSLSCWTDWNALE